MQMAIYAGWPSAANGLAVAAACFTGEDAGGAAYGFTVGSVRVTVVSDGFVELPAAVFGAGVEPGEVARLLDARGIADPVPVALSPLVIEHPEMPWCSSTPAPDRPRARTPTAWSRTAKATCSRTCAAPDSHPARSTSSSSPTATTTTGAP